MTDPVLSIDTDKKSRLRLEQQLDILCMPRAERRRMMRMILTDVRTQARRNASMQTTITGEKFTPRTKRAKNRRRMLMKLPRQLSVVVKSDHHGDVEWRNKFSGMLARRHQDGIPSQHSATNNKCGWFTSAFYNKKATPRMAKALKRNGYRRPVARKRGKGKAILKKVPLKWITDNMTMRQAGLIFRILVWGNKQKPKQWTVNLPSRAFLGVTPKDADAFLADLAREALSKLKRA